MSSPRAVAAAPGALRVGLHHHCRRVDGIAQLACAGMGRKVDLDDLMDATDVANLIGVTNANVVGVYRRRYDNFPPPVWASRGGRCQLWVRADVEVWARATGRSEAWAPATGRRP